MKSHQPTRIDRRKAVAMFFSGAALATTGCPLGMPESLPSAASNDASGAESSVIDRVRETLAKELQTRGLSTTRHGAWQIFHGILAYGADFEVDTPSGRSSAVDYFASGGTCSGFRPTIGDSLNAGRFGLRVDIQPTTKVGQGHRDQWIAVVAQAGVPLEAQWTVADRQFKIADWLRQAELDVPLNLEAEFSWTLIPLSLYQPTDHRWVARDGETYSTDLLLEAELQHDLESSVCGGTHRLIGIAFALGKRLEEGSNVDGVWQRARQRIAEAIELAKKNQNPDGSYSTAYLHRTGWCNDLGEMLGTTGHVLEFLAIAADVDVLRASWVERTVVRLCDLLDTCQGIDLECGALYHALHGLAVYERRIAHS